MSEHQDPRPRDDTDAVRDIARDLAEVSALIAAFKGEANVYLGDPGYDAFWYRPEIATRRWRRGGGCGSRRAAKIVQDRLRGIG